MSTFHSLLSRSRQGAIPVVAMLALVVATSVGALAYALPTLVAARVLAGLFGGPATSLALSIVAAPRSTMSSALASGTPSRLSVSGGPARRSPPPTLVAPPFAPSPCSREPNEYIPPGPTEAERERGNARLRGQAARWLRGGGA